MSEQKLVIENGIPIPPVKRLHAGGRLTFLRTLKKGQSVLLHMRGNNARTCAAQAFGSGNYISREVIPGKTYRVWRTG
jgi:hypothetical protein